MPITPTWLPPLNAHDNYHIQASAWQYPLLMDDPRLTAPLFLIDFYVSLDFYSKDPTVKRCLEGLYMRETVRIACNSIPNFKQRSKSRQIISNMIYNIPFYPLRRIHWEGENSSRTVLDNEDDLTNTLLDFLWDMKAASYNSRRKILPLKLVIRKTVMIPPHEFEAWTSWYDEQKKWDSNFDKNYRVAISRPRCQSELENKEALTFRSIPATESAVEDLD